MSAQVRLQTVDLSRSFGQYQALKPTNLVLHAGEVTVLTGPNGAGKTTLLLCLSSLLKPTTGQVLIEGHDLYQDERAAKQQLAFVPDVPRFYQELTAWEHLQWIAMAYGVRGKPFEERARQVLETFGLWQARDLFPHNFSRGMRLKLGLSMAWMHPFSVLLLDEPTSALDPQSTVILQEQILQSRSEGAAVLLSSHNLQLAEAVGDQQWQMHTGQVDTP